jgi:phage-related protein
MPLPLSSVAIAEKNKLTAGSVFLLLLEITIPGVGTPIRVVGNNEDITWRTYTWQAFPFELDEISDGNKGEVPRVDLRVSNVSRAMEVYLADYDAYTKANGYSPVTVSIFVLNSLNLASATPEVEHIFELTQPKTNSLWATFTLGAENLFSRRFPVHRILKNHCRFHFNYPPGNDLLCGWSGGGFTTCGKTLTDCRARSNSSRFGGFLGVGASGLRIA